MTADPHSFVVEAAIALADADTSDDAAYDRAVDRHRKAAQTWLRSLGWRGPGEQEEGVKPQELDYASWLKIGSELRREIEGKRMRAMAEVEKLDAQLANLPQAAPVEVVPEPAEQAAVGLTARVLEQLRVTSAKSPAELAEALGAERKAVVDVLYRLKKRGAVTQAGRRRQKYSLAEPG